MAGKATVDLLWEEVKRLRKLDREAATYVETVICMRTGFTGDPPYVGWKGLGLALTEALDERDRLRAEVERLKSRSHDYGAGKLMWAAIEDLKAGESS